MSRKYSDRPEYVKTAVQKRRLKIKAMAIEYKGGACSRCGYDRCPDALEFHHLDPAEKDFGVGTSGHCRSWERVKAELDKCIMVCSNCHREIQVLGYRPAPTPTAWPTLSKGVVSSSPSPFPKPR